LQLAAGRNHRETGVACKPEVTTVRAKCEACHTQLPDSALSIMPAGAPQLIKDGIDEDAADGILVVQVRRLRTVS
jgi:hypothetical protein